MIDLHMHILPGIDDGAMDMEEALDMARIAVYSGTTVCAATSHGKFSRRRPAEHLACYEETLARFREELKKRRIGLDVRSGMELMADESLMRYARSHTLPGYENSPYILVEFYFDISAETALERLDALGRMGYRVVLAHPERYDFMVGRPEIAGRLYRNRVVLQVNAGSILGKFGPRVFRTADRILKNGLAGLMASDAHNSFQRSPDMEEAEELLDIHYGSGASRILLEENPRRILEGRQVLW